MSLTRIATLRARETLLREQKAKELEAFETRWDRRFDELFDEMRQALDGEQGPAQSGTVALARAKAISAQRKKPKFGGTE